PQYSNDDEGARRRNWELARRQEWERQRRRGQPPGFQPPGFGWGQQNGGMYPPEPQQYQRQYPQERGGGRPQQDGYGNNYDPGIPQPPQRRQPGFFQGLFGGN
ncbi:MAG: hypothetical protein ACXVA9_01825, partial [Bdellovibrionales bacterium]